MERVSGEHEELVRDRLKDLSDAVGRLVQDHVELAKSELKSTARTAGRDLGLAAAGAALAALGYVLWMLAVAWFIGLALGLGWALLIVGGFHLVVGFGLAGAFVQRLRSRDRPGLPQTTSALREDRDFLGEIGQIVRGDVAARER